jgi:RNA polymerase sigma-70 factor (ECF subfamily)
MARGRPLANVRPQLEERQQIEAAQRDPGLFAALYEENFDRVYSYVTARVRDRAAAQDLTAHVFHHALENLAAFEWRGTPFMAWLYRIAGNAVVDHLKRTAREQTGDLPDLAEEPDFDDIERRAKIFRLVKELPDDQRRVVEMRFVDDCSIRDVARAIGRSEGAVKQLQFRALQKLRDQLGEHHG